MEPSLVKIAILCGNGIGGTEKAAFLFALELSRRGHTIELLTDPSGPRTLMLKDAGILLIDIPYESDALEKYLSSSRPDIIHQHVSGYGDHRPLYDALDRLDSGKPKLIETNVFGQMWDINDHGHVDFRMFVSMASGTQAFSRPQFNPCSRNPAKNGILYNPLPSSSVSYTDLSLKTRQELGILSDEFFVVRIGRPGGKWASWECETYKIAKQKNPKIRMLLMEPTPDISNRISKGEYGEGIIVKKTTSDFEYLEKVLYAADVMLHASSWGESYGYTIAEALQVGLPVVTRTTPWGDNAQVELVKNGQNGFVCCSVEGMAAALIQLSEDLVLRKEMSIAASQGIKEFSDLSFETDILEEIIAWVTQGTVGLKMTERHNQWTLYAIDFRKAEWRVYEKDKCKYLALVYGWLYSTFRSTKFLLGSWLRRRKVH